MPIRVRFAPSPTGHLHVGGARTALFNWLLARREGGVFILRIEDTDRDRSSEEMVSGILSGMRWLGLAWDEGPFFQSQGVRRHQDDATALLSRGLAYRDFTSADELQEVRRSDPARATRYPRERAEALGLDESQKRAEAGEAYAIRFRVPEGETSWTDLVHGDTRFRNADIEDLVLLRTDGTPTYNLAVASDDARMRISHVIRGDDHISNTPKQILLHRALGNPIPSFAHLPMILGPDGRKLSKRHGTVAVTDYRSRGILPDAMINFLALMGWSPGGDEEVMSRDRLIQTFSLDRVLKKAAVFDPEKLEWLNGQHLSRMRPEDLVESVLSELGTFREEGERRRREEPAWFLGLVGLLKQRARTPAEIALRAQIFLARSVEIEPDAAERHWYRRVPETLDALSALESRLENTPWEPAALEEAVRSLADDRGVGAGRLIHPLRVALTGQTVSPGIFEVLEFLGRDRALLRIRDARTHLLEEHV